MKNNYDVECQPVSVDSSKDNELMLQAGDVDFAIIALGDVTANIQNGTYKIIAVFSTDKPQNFPDAPLRGLWHQFSPDYSSWLCFPCRR